METRHIRFIKMPVGGWLSFTKHWTKYEATVQAQNAELDKIITSIYTRFTNKKLAGITIPNPKDKGADINLLGPGAEENHRRVC